MFKIRQILLTVMVLSIVLTISVLLGSSEFASEPEEDTLSPPDQHHSHPTADPTPSIGNEKKGTETPHENGRDLNPRLHVLTYASKSVAPLCRFLRSALHNDVSPTVLGLGSGNHKLGFKISSVLEYVQNEADSNDIILFTDAYDVLFVGGEKEILKRFEELEQDDFVVFTGEKGCWPYLDGRPNGRHICNNVYPPATTPYRYLNSGAYIGRAHAVLRVLSDSLKYSPSTKIEDLNDQGSISDIYVYHNEEAKILLDTECKLFQSLHLSFDDLQVDHEGKFFNVLTNMHPIILHFNGGSKKLFAEMDAKAWYYGKGLEGHAKKTFNEICHELVDNHVFH
jgi:hypothetical protein